jgi:hypothetical protein
MPTMFLVQVELRSVHAGESEPSGWKVCVVSESQESPFLTPFIPLSESEMDRAAQGAEAQ